MIIQTHPEVLRLRIQIQDLKEQVSALLEKEALLQHHTLPYLNALYEQSIGIHEYQVLLVRVEVNELKHRIEWCTALLNRGQEISPEDLERLEQEVLEISARWNKELLEKERLLDASRLFLDPSNFLTPVEEQRLKQLYRALCLLLHPDVAKDPELHTLYWSRVQEAYAHGDIKKLETLLVAVEARDPATDWEQESELEALRTKRDRLESLVLRQSERLDEIEGALPFCLAEQLADASWVEEKQQALRQTVEALTKRRDELREIYETLLDRHGSRVH